MDNRFSRSGFKVKTGLHAGKPLGDSFADVTHFMGVDRLANFYTQVTGKECGCNERMQWMNKAIPEMNGQFTG